MLDRDKAFQDAVTGRLRKAHKTATYSKENFAIKLMDCLIEEIASEFWVIDEGFNKGLFIRNARGE